MGQPLMILLVLLMLPLSLKDSPFLQKFPLSWLGVASLGAPLMYATSQATLYDGQRGLKWLVRLPLLVMLGVGAAVNNTRAVIEALLGVRSPFERTPKLGVIRRGSRWQRSRHEPIRIGISTWIELGMAVYAAVIAVITLKQGNWIGSFFSTLYALGFAWTVGATLWEAQGFAAGSRL
jgi:hypothetical protein